MITGLLRNFIQELYPYLLKLSELIDLDIYIYTTKDCFDTKYLSNNNLSIEDFYSNKHCKLFAIDTSEIEGIENLTQREKNIFYQWKKVYLCFQAIQEKSYDYIIRIRPDIKPEFTPEEFLKSLVTLDPKILAIPFGNDLYTKAKITSLPCINDQFAVANYSVMKVYCSFYNYLVNIKHTQPVVSEALLYNYLLQNNIKVMRFELPYTLSLSQCSVLAISGNSGAGKTTVVNAIQKVFPFDSSLVLETDRYHKWERYSKEWNDYTHLHPNANNLEKLIDDTYLLKMGETINVVDYDHSTGKFTAPQSIQPKNYVFLCGLHTFYKDAIRSHIDFKLFIDTEEQLNTYWKVRRDIEQRGHTAEHVLKSIEHRKTDLERFILPQKEYADCILETIYTRKIESFEEPLQKEFLTSTIIIKSSLCKTLGRFLSMFSSKQTIVNDTVRYLLYNNISSKKVINLIHEEKIHLENIEDIQDDALGIIQLIVLIRFLKPVE